MQLEVDTSVQTTAKISFNVPAEEFETEVKNGLRQASQNVRMKGFRPGKVPLKVLEKQYGESIRGEVKERFIQKAYGQALEENKLKPIAHPRLTPEEMELQGDGSFQVAFEVPLRPTFDLPKYRGLETTTELEPVMDEQIDTTLDEIRQQQSTPEAAGDDGMDEKGFVIANISFEHEGEQVFEREGMRLNTASVPPGVDAESFSAGLVGVKDGEKLEFPMELPEFLENEELRGKPGTCVLNVTQAMKLVPPSDDTIVEMLSGGAPDAEIQDMEGVRRFIRERLEENSQERENQRIETVLLDQVLQAVQVELPQSMLEQQTEARLNQLAAEMTQKGSSEEEIEAAKAEQKDAAYAEAEKGLKALLVVEAIGETEELLVNNDDMGQELQSIAMRNQTTVQEVQEYYSKNNLGQQLAIEILEKKVRRFLRENADIKAPE
ncbi:Trigger factor [Planctomycetes bacterium Poly30]|uniref:Trigger factor n=1 Tax=Saltatorellus ferox TaxID=2528018 RepID=A0A518ES59_9BACT|nr:Trigger factor [Planctomycetes bacterium Poly30]